MESRDITCRVANGPLEPRSDIYVRIFELAVSRTTTTYVLASARDHMASTERPAGQRSNGNQNDASIPLLLGFPNVSNVSVADLIFIPPLLSLLPRTSFIGNLQHACQNVTYYEVDW